MPRKTYLPLLIWPLFCVAAAAALWLATLTRIESDRAVALKNAHKDAAFLTKAYADQMAVTIGMLDQMGRSIQWIYERAPNTFRLEAQNGMGLYPDTDAFYISLFNQDGDLISTSLHAEPGQPSRGRPVVNVRDRAYFQSHFSDPGLGLLISKPSVGRVGNKVVIRLSRRLNGADGSFKGVLAIAVDPGYIAGFYDRNKMRPSDYLSLRAADGELLVSRIANTITTSPALFKSVPVLAGTGVVTEYGPERFNDRKSRIMAWDAVGDYPLYALVGLTESDALSEHADTARAMLVHACEATAVLAAVCLAGMRAIRRRRRKRERAEQSRASYQAAVDASREAFYTLAVVRDDSGGISDFIVEECNQRGAEFLETVREGLIGASLTALMAEPENHRLWARLRQAIATGFAEDEYFRPAAGSQSECWYSRRFVRTARGLAVTVCDVTETRRMSTEVDALTNFDALTKLPNRHWLLEFLPSAILIASAEHKKIALLHIDLDDFKDVNNSIGHRCGDAVLLGVASIVRACVAAGDHVVRLGGDEFVIVLIQAATANAPSAAADRIFDAMRAPILLGDASAHCVNISMGISRYPDDADDADALIQRAGIAMHAAKTMGKCRYQIYAERLGQELHSRRTIEADLRQAIASDELVLYFQPRVDAMTGAIVSMEALLRWRHPERGMVSPLEFVAIAEETGLILPIGAQVIEKACKQLASWRSQAVPLIPISVNVSPRQFSEGNLALTIETALATHRIDASLLEVEITESCMMGDDKAVSETLSRIQRMGIKLLVDDFGTGYSSLSQLQRLDLDILKVDRAFTRNLQNGKQGEIFFRAIISMAHAIGMSVVAEGVETLDQFQTLQKLACDEIQGYFISRPVPAHEMSALIRKKHLLPAGAHATVDA